MDKSLADFRKTQELRKAQVDDIWNGGIQVNEDMLEKGITDGLSMYKAKEILSKKIKGTEFKTKLAAIRVKIEAEKKTCCDKMQEIEGKLTEKPDYEIRSYSDSDVKPMKTYSWEAQPNSKMDQYQMAIGQVQAPAADNDVSVLMSKHRSLTYDCLRRDEELETIGFYERNIEDNKLYELTGEQLKALGY